MRFWFFLISMAWVMTSPVAPASQFFVCVPVAEQSFEDLQHEVRQIIWAQVNFDNGGVARSIRVDERVLVRNYDSAKKTSDIGISMESREFVPDGELAKKGQYLLGSEDGAYRMSHVQIDHILQQENGQWVIRDYARCYAPDAYDNVEFSCPMGDDEVVKLDHKIAMNCAS